MNSLIRRVIATGFYDDFAKISVIVLLFLFPLFFITMAVNFFIHCEHATIFKKYNLCYFHTPTGFHNSSWEIKAPADWTIK